MKPEQGPETDGEHGCHEEEKQNMKTTVRLHVVCLKQYIQNTTSSQLLFCCRTPVPIKILGHHQHYVRFPSKVYFIC